MAILISCSLGQPTQTAIQNQAVNVANMTLQVNPAQAHMEIIPTYVMPMMIASPMSTRIPPNTPVWSVYNYTCELADGGGNMTMNLGWTDRSTSEESYKVYRDKQLIATLAPNSTFYVDVVFVATGKTVSYSVEAFATDWQVSTSTITHGCQ
jgi:diadenosine tetraphosphate (Ap4A) HIT family hydrolase